MRSWRTCAAAAYDFPTRSRNPLEVLPAPAKSIERRCPFRTRRCSGVFLSDLYDSVEDGGKARREERGELVAVKCLSYQVRRGECSHTK